MEKLLIFILPLVFLATSCKKVDALKGKQETFEIQVGSFEKIEQEGIGVINYVSDTNESLSVTCSKDVYEALEIFVTENKLVVRVRKGWTIKNGENIEINVSSPNVNSFKIASSGSISANLNNNQISGAEFIISGSGNLHAFNIDNNGRLEAKIQASGNMTLEGTTDDAELTIGASGNMSNFNLTSTNVEARITGSGNIECTANSILDVLISASGNVYYKGNPTINQEITGSGSIINAN